MNTQKQIIAALDGGFGNYKTGWLNGDGTIHTAAVAADVGIGDTELGLLTAGTDRKYRQVKPRQVFCAGQRYLVGDNVHRWSGRVYERRTDYLRLGDAPEIRPLTYAALAPMLDSVTDPRLNPNSNGNGREPAPPEAGPTLHLVVGFPVEIMEDKPRARSILAALKKWLLGEHHFELDGRPYNFSVARVALMPQPFGTYGSWAYNPDGSWARSKADFDAPVCVADVGYNTFDMYGLERGTIVGHLSRGQDLGLHRAIEAIVQEVRAAYGVELSNGEADQMIRDHTKNREVLVHTPTGSHTINHIIQQGLDLCFAGLSEHMRANVRPGDYRYLLLAGGGLLSLKKPFLHQYPDAFIPANPVTSNVDGLARRAQWYFIKKSPMPGS